MKNFLEKTKGKKSGKFLLHIFTPNFYSIFVAFREPTTFSDKTVRLPFCATTFQENPPIATCISELLQQKLHETST